MFAADDLDALRERMPEYLRRVHGVDVREYTRKPFRCIHPGHDDHNPSMSFDPRTNRVRCFSCGAAGDIFEVAGWGLGRAGFPECVRHVADVTGYALHEDQGPLGGEPLRRPVIKRPAPKPPEPPEQPSGPDLMDKLALCYRSLFEPEGAAAKQYLAERGFNLDDTHRHGFTWALHPSELMDGFDSAPRNEAGYVLLPFPSDAAFAICRYVVARPLFHARFKEVKPAGQPSPVWREYLLTQPGEIYMTEGIFDAAALALLLGIEGKDRCAALMGVGGVSRMLAVIGNTPADQRPALVTLALDGDAAGRAATAKASDGLAKLGVPCRDFCGAGYPGGAHDPNDAWCDVLREGRCTE